jgi:hypothetical protein
MFLKNFKIQKVFLGRWGTVNNYSIVNKKIDFSNMDNCFTSGFKFVKKRKVLDEETIIGIICYSDLGDKKN